MIIGLTKNEIQELLWALYDSKIENREREGSNKRCRNKLKMKLMNIKNSEVNNERAN